MVRLRLSELDDAVKAFLAPAQQGQTIVIEDDAGQLQCGVTPYVQATPAEKQAALEALDRLQLKTSQNVEQLRVSEVDVDRELQN
ncbi:MAG: hypothetical protein AB7G28_19875 [Pirellulales bacterium]